MKAKLVMPLIVLLSISFVQAQPQNLTVDIQSRTPTQTFSLTNNSQEQYTTSMQVTLANKGDKTRDVNLYAGVCGENHRYVWNDLASGCVSANTTFSQVFNPTQGLIDCTKGVNSGSSCKKSVTINAGGTETESFNITVPEDTEEEVFNAGIYAVDSDLGVVHIERRNIETENTGILNSIIIYIDNLVKNIT